MDPARIATLAVAVVLGLLATGICVLTFWPAFRGPDAARQAVGTHRLVFGSIVFVLLLNTLLTLPLVQLGYLRLEGGFTTTTFFLSIVSTDLPLFLFVYLRLILPGAVSWRELGMVPLSLDATLRWGLGGGLAGLVIIDLVVGTALSQFGFKPNQIEQLDFVLHEGPLAFAILLFAIGVLAPFFEELFFRGFLFGLYRRRQPTWVAYLVSCVLFTLPHLMPTRMDGPQLIGLSVGIFLLAVGLTWLYQHTGSLFPGMLAHAVNNASGLILFYAAGVR